MAAKKATRGDRPPLPDESPADKKEHAAKILSQLKKLYPDATCALHWSNPLELLIATILSAQCTDQRVNMVTPTLFARYKTAGDYAKATLAEIEKIIQSTGFYHNKAKSIQGACQIIAEQHGGQVPRTMDQMLELPGVARKTANVVLGTAYGMNEGVVVDTHVGRVAWRLGLTWTARDTKDPVRIEQDLMQIVPRKAWTLFAHARWSCTAGTSAWPASRAAASAELAPFCPSAFTFEDAADDEDADADD